ncbi:MAG: hypothetical protein HY270_05415, partial [Deltaproteobacteria bacterium]|nr:hypothetical protein [Deltaproteobacteria bacterium]
MAGSLPIVAAPDYSEMLIGVAGVRLRKAATPFVYIARGYSNSALTVFNGNQFYGFTKQPARFWWQEPFCLITDGAERLLWQVQIEGKGTPTGSQAWRKLAAIFRQPILGRIANGSFVVSYFDWDLSGGSCREAMLRDADEGSAIAQATQREWTSLPQAGVMLSRLRWRLSWPTPLR